MLSLQDRLTSRLGDALGLGEAVDALTLARTDRARLGAQLLAAITHRRLLPADDLYRIVPRRTWIRRKSEGALAPAEFDGLFRLVRLQILADLVFGDAERAREWLHSPKQRLGNVSPVEFASDALGMEAIEDWLHEIDQGFFG